MRARTVRAIVLVATIEVGAVAPAVCWLLNGGPWPACLLYGLIMFVSYNCIFFVVR